MSLPACFSTADPTAAPLAFVDAASLPAWLERQPEALRNWVRAQGYAADPDTVLTLPDARGGLAGALVGIGDPADPYALAHAPLALPPGTYRLGNEGSVAVAPAVALLGWGLGAYQYERYRKPPRAPARLCLGDDAAAQSEAFSLLKASTLVRDLVNTPTEHMGPDELEAVAVRLGEAYGGAVQAIRGENLLRENFPAIHAVGRASHRAPRLIELTWGDPADPRLALVGKGVCFDTGGLDLKSADGMRHMKKDMGGAAHALALAQLVMANRLPVHLHLLVAAVENAVGPDAFRPGEVLATRAGISVEVDNTDAEGRLVLCDALHYAGESRPDLLLDFATLTGAARVALGPDLPALYVNDEALAQDWLAAAVAQRDPLWRMPLWQPYLSFLKSPIADLANSGGSRMAGSVTAALFLQRFIAEGQRWGHLDVYSWNDIQRPGRPPGGEAQGLRAAYAMLKARYRRV
ncbi:MAG: leucyl aminopeptidase family protein [Lysobacteraceae bacterium]